MLKEENDRIRVEENRGLNIKRRKCERCLFGDNPHLPWLPYGREKIESILQEDRTFTCHEYQNVVCRGFYNRHKRDVFPIRLALLYDLQNWID